MESSGRGRSGQGGGRGSAGRGRNGRSGMSSNYQKSQYHDSVRGGQAGSGGSRAPPPQQYPYVGGYGSTQPDHHPPQFQSQGGGRSGNCREFAQSEHSVPQFQHRRDGRSGNGRGMGYAGRGLEAGHGYKQSSDQSPPVSVWANPNMGRGEGRGTGVWGMAQTCIPGESQRCPPPEPLPELLSSEMSALSLSASVCQSSASSAGKLVPIRRPDLGQKFERTCNLVVNHFPVKFNPETIVMHYDVDIKEERSSKSNSHRRVSKSDLGMIRKHLLSDHSWQSMFMTAYDGEKNIFSVESLPTGNFPIELSEETESKKRTFVVTIKLVNELRVCKLRDYLMGRDPSLPRDVLQGMDLVVKENPTRQMIPIGRSFYPKQFFPSDDLGHGIAAHRGFQHSLKPTSDGLVMCLDTSVLALRKPQPVLAFLHDQIGGFSLNSFSKFRRQVEEALIGLKVMVTHRRTKQKYTIANLTDQNTRSLTFEVEDPEGVAMPRNVSIEDYFMEKYAFQIRERDIPCLNLGKNNRINYVPLELCVLVEGQIYPKENLDRNTARLLKNISLAPPKERRNLIEDIVQSDFGPSGGGIVQRFGMQIDDRMTHVKGRVIGAPRVKLGGGEVVRLDPEKRHWNLLKKTLIQGKQLTRWAVVDFTASDKRRYIDPNCFIPALINRCTNLGIRTSEPVFYQPSNMNILSNAPNLHQFLDEQSRRNGGNFQLFVCVMTERHFGYKQLKWFCETRLGFVSQCCLSDPVNKLSDQTLANLALKINAKLGGINFELADRLPHFERDNQVMILGADVNHPAPRNITSPSIAAVVGTMNWPGMNRYAARVTPQSHRIETILNFGSMCMDLVDAYASSNSGSKPSKILIFRDGVSEPQFAMVLNEELADLKKTFESRNYRPTVTLINARKRHQTRLFPSTPHDGGSTGNVHPGTVVDTRIVHPFEFDFFMCSHYGGIGTSKPTHYQVLWDEHGLRSDELHQLVYNLCFTFARCTKPISLVPPVYYADLVAYRGRLYQEAVFEKGGDEGFREGVMYKLHENIVNSMFFV